MSIMNAMRRSTSTGARSSASRSFTALSGSIGTETRRGLSVGNGVGSCAHSSARRRSQITPMPSAVNSRWPRSVRPDIVPDRYNTPSRIRAPLRVS
jgi:hypothetical protein